MPKNISTTSLEEQLRLNENPVVARISDDKLIIDMRCILEDEIEILKRKSQENPLDTIRSVCKPQDIIELQKQVDQVYVDDKIYDYIVRIIHKTRDHELIQQGASPRTSISLLKMVKAIAYMDHRNYVIPDDIKKVIYDVLSHRLILTYDAKVKGVVIQDVIQIL